MIAGIREGSAQDRTVSFISVLFTSIPEIATAIFLTVIFALWRRVPLDRLDVIGDGALAAKFVDRTRLG